MIRKLPVLILLAAILFASCGKELEFNTAPASANAVTVSTFAGDGTQGSANGAGTTASFFNPTGVAADTLGNVYVADYRNDLIRKITAAGVVSIFAGGISSGSANGTGTYASFYLPAGIAIDKTGNIYVGDTNNHLIREISHAGIVTTLAGNGTSGLVNGPAAAASFNYPQGIAVDGAGNVYVADSGNNLIRKVSAAGIVSTLAGNGAQGAVNGVDTAATFDQPTGVAVDAAGNVYVADYGNDLIRKISVAGSVTTLAGSGAAGSADGAATAASFNGATGIAVDASGNVYVADYGNSLIRMVTPAGVVSTVGSKELSAANNPINHPYGLTVDSKGNIYVANYGNSTIQKISK